jgi:sulfhydrogenase subunit beta (sulfur reductase)
METMVLRQDKLAELVNALVRDGEVIAPKDEIAYGQIGSGSELDLRPTLARKSLKEFFFPQREEMLAYSLGADGVSVVSPPAPAASRVVFTRPCDAASLPILDKLFNWDLVDRFYAERRDATTIISLACDQPTDACFCVSLGGAPAGVEGSDLLLSPIDGVYQVQVLTERGKKLVETYRGFFQESNEKLNQQQSAAAAEWRDKITRNVDVEKVFNALKFDNPVWEGAAKECVDCGICTFLCPTCHCFDIRDEGDPDQGSRVRLWDSCAFAEYTQMPAHQPRPRHHQRYRQRIMHKFRYYREN